MQEKDDPQAAAQIAAMDRTYSSALVTIVSATASSAAVPRNDKVNDQEAANVGSDIFIPGVTRSRIDVNEKGHEDTYSRTWGMPRLSAAMRDGATVVAPFPSSQNLSETVWNTRAWTFQEKLLSRRLLIFSGNEVAWHCRSMVCREDMRTDDSGHVVQPLEWLSLKPKFFDQTIHAHWMDGSLKRDQHGRTHIVRSGTYVEYVKVIREYTSRQMSFKSDIVRALEGLLQIFRRSFRSEFTYGLPKSLLDIALLWRPSCRLRRRVCDDEQVFPSWSWAGWEGRVHYGDAMEIDRDSEGGFLGHRMGIDGEEGVRPMLRWYHWHEKTATLKPLNGHGRGFPLDTTGFPREWEGSPSPRLKSSAIASSVSGIRFQKHHLIFQTGSVRSSQFEYVEEENRPKRHLWELGRWEEQKPDDVDSPHRLGIVDYDGRRVGRLVLDGEDPLYLSSGRYELLLLAEAQLLGDKEESLVGEFRCCVVMLVERNADETYSRCGLGRIYKDAWKQGMPSIKTVVLS
ncbi:hypothetical protein ACJ41O_008470 [Fusarium nematophilum]